MNYHQSNYLFDLIMPAVKPNTFKVIAAVARLTWGYQRDCYDISFSEFMNVTGIKNKTTLSNAIQDAIDEGHIARVEWANTYKYQMIKVFRGGTENRLDSTEIVPASTETVPDYDNQDGTEIVPDGTVSVHDRYRNRTKNGTETVPKYSGLKEKETLKENIYIHPDSPQIAELKTAVASITKTVMTFDNDDTFGLFAEWLHEHDCTPEKVKGFSKWWFTPGNGYYQGKPALKSVMDEFQNYLDGVTLSNGRHPPEEKQERTGGVY